MFGSTSTDESHGINMAPFNAQTGQLGEAIKVSNAIRPGFIIIHPDGQHLYATDTSRDVPEKKGHSVSAYRIEKSGMLNDLNTQPSGGEGPCHISLSPNAQYLLAANYRGGSCAVLPVLKNGELGEPTAVKQHECSGPNLTRQDKAHTHSFNCDPSGKFAIAADLGTDQILSYRLRNGSLSLDNITKAPPGAGPRHLTFHPNRKFAYISMELNGTVSAYEYNVGTLTKIQTAPTLPADFKGENTVSEICISPDGRFLYVGNRGHDSLATFAVNPDDGKLTTTGHQSTLGEHPRHFNIDPTGTFLIAANMYSDNIAVFRIDRQTGRLEPTGSEITVPNASCVQFYSL